jgi:hypothetical protein
MHLILVLAVLPVVYIVAWLLTPVLVVLHSTMTVGEYLRQHVGAWAEMSFLVGLFTAVAGAFESRRFFWFGLLPLLLGTVVVARL